MRAWHMHVHCVTVQNTFKVQNSCRELCLYDSTAQAILIVCATLQVCHMQCTEIMTAQSVCGKLRFLSQNVGLSVLAVDLLTTVSLTAPCCT